MRGSWLKPHWRGRRRIDHPVRWARLPECDVGVAFVQSRAPHGHENRWLLYVRRWNDADVQAIPVLAQTVITSSAGSTQTITSDATWNNSNNSIEVIGAGARGAIGASTSTSGGGAGGGAYSKIVNASITTPGTTQYFARVGGVTATNGSAGGDSWWTLTSPGTAFPTTGTAVGAKGGAALASATSNAGGLGGALASAYASPATSSVKTSGGNGGNAGASNASGGGGGGAGGAAGNGTAGGTGPGAGGVGNVSTGNLGGAGGPAGNGAGAVGGAGSNLSTSPTAGSGGGGGGGNASASTGGQGGLYGGGGGGGGRSTGVGGQGRQGVIVLTWTVDVSGTLATTDITDAASKSGSVAWNAAMAGIEGTVYELLLHLEGADASTTITDSGGKNQTVTAHGAAQIDTGQSVFAGQALMVASTDDYVSADTGDFAFGTGDFTIDFRARLSSGSATQVFYEGGAGGFKIHYDGSALKFTSAAGTITGSALSANTNYHIAATRASGSTRLWKDGAQQGSTLTDATDYTSTAGYPRIGATGYDAATSAWAAAVASAGGSLSDTRKGQVDTLIVALKADGIWSKLDRLWLFAATDTQTALLDLKSLQTATAVSSPTFTQDRGFTGNGSSSYINPNFNPIAVGGNCISTSACGGIWDTTTTVASASTVQIGSYDGVGYGVDISLKYSDNNLYARTASNTGPAGVTYPGPGLFLGDKNNTAQNVYRNGSSITSGGAGAAYIPNQGIYILARNSSGTASNFSVDQVAAALFAASLTGAEHANVYTRLRAYMTAVGVP